MMFTVREFVCFVPLQTLRPLWAADSRQPNILWCGCQRANPSPLSSKSAYFHHDNCTRHQLPFVLTPFCVRPSFFPAGAFESESLGLEVHRAGNFLWHRSVGFVDIKVGSFASLQPGTCLQLAGRKSLEGASRVWTQKDEKSNYVEQLLNNERPDNRSSAFLQLHTQYSLRRIPKTSKNLFIFLTPSKGPNGANQSIQHLYEDAFFENFCGSARIEAASGAWNARSEGLHGADQVNLQLPSSKRLKVIG